MISRQFAYHGSNAYGTSLGGMAALTDVYGRLVPDVEQVPWDDAEALAEAIDRPVWTRWPRSSPSRSSAPAAC